MRQYRIEGLKTAPRGMQIVLHLKTKKFRLEGEALEIIKLNARHFRFNQPPATSEINSIHKSSQKWQKQRDSEEIYRLTCESWVVGFCGFMQNLDTL